MNLHSQCTSLFYQKVLLFVSIKSGVWTDKLFNVTNVTVFICVLGSLENVTYVNGWWNLELSLKCWLAQDIQSNLRWEDIRNCKLCATRFELCFRFHDLSPTLDSKSICNFVSYTQSSFSSSLTQILQLPQSDCFD